MNYSKHYAQLINKANNRILDGYYEVHHIIPRCMGGNNKKSNLINLTAREHFIAHLLLCKMYPNNRKLILAATMMCVGQTERKVTNRIYNWLRCKHAIAMSELQSKCNNSQYGTKWIYNLELKQSKKINNIDEIPHSWYAGRIINFNKIIKIKPNKRAIQKEQNKQLANRLYQIYISNNFKSIRKFSKSVYYNKSHVSLTKLWKKYVHEYANNTKLGKGYQQND